MSEATIFVQTAEIKAAVEGHEEAILDALGINWRQRGTHVTCPYPEHGGESDWRWDSRKLRAYCTCSTKGDHVIEVLRKCEGLDYDEAKLRTADLIGRQDLIRTKGGKGQKTDAFSLLNPSTSIWDRELPRAYLAHRLGIAADQVLIPVTKVAGWRALAYFDPPAKGGGKPVLVGEFPCVVFGTVAADGGTHAHRIYTAPDGAGKAELGKNAAGYDRDPKKSAKAAEGAPSTAGRSVIWGDPQTAERIVVAEGIETAAAVAHVFRQEVEAGAVAVAAAISAGGIAAFQIYPATKRVTVAADRDEAVKPSKPAASRTGEKMAREFGMRNADRCIVDIAMPGRPGASTDWLDIMLSDGADAVRSGIEAAVRFVPTQAELDERAQRAGREAELRQMEQAYPLPALNGRKLTYLHTQSGKVWIHKEILTGKGEDKVPMDIPIASPFGITARLRMVDAEDAYGLRLVVQDMGGRARNIDVDRGALAAMGGVEARRLFLANGVRFEDDGPAVAVAALMAADPEDEITIVRHPGWHEVEGVKVYVAPDGTVIGLPEGVSLELSEGARLSPSVARGGTLKGWKEAAEAAIAAPNCPHFTLGLAAGFAGVLIDLCGMDSCGINLSGQTSAGKTTAQKLAASIWSAPDPTRDGLFQTAKTTVNGLEFIAAKANASVLALDELAHLSGKEVARVIYTLASGTGKKRMTAGATLREPHKWRTFAILSAETSLEAKIKADGEQWTGGQAVRVVDVDVTNINRLLDATTFATITSVSRHYGHAGPAFARAIVEAGTHNNAADIWAGINTLAKRIAGQAADSATIRAALPFATMMMGGHMAQEFGLLPRGDAIKSAVKWAWAGFAKSSDAVALDPAAQAIGNIRQWIAERWNTSIHWLDAEQRPNRDAVGWWDDEAVYITPDRLCEAAGGTQKEAMIGKALNAASMIAKTKGPEHLCVSWVPKVGKLKAYALSRDHFGRGPGDEPQEKEESFKVHAGGRQ